MAIVGIDLGVEKTRVGFFDKTCINPMIIANSNGYGTFSENSIAETFLELKKKIGTTEAVIVVSRCFNISQCRLIKNIGEKTGIEIKRILHKSSAVALAYEFGRSQNQRREEEHLAVCTIEKGIFEIAIAEMGEGIAEIRAIDWENGFVEVDNNRFRELFKRICKEQYPRSVADAADGQSTTGKIFSPDAIIISGDPSYFTALQPAVTHFFKKEPESIQSSEELTVIGASIQGAILCGDVKDIYLLDITSQSLGVELFGDTVEVIIPRNTTIPTRHSRIFPVDMHKRATVNINVYEGEKKIAVLNHLIGNLSIPRISQGETEIEVTIDIDANGSINMQAKDLGGGDVYSLSI
jgi:molecular chaperone DnaK (HSP70)